LERVRTSLSREEFFAKYELAPDRKLIAVLPGSRRGEIRFHLPVLAEAIKKIQAGIPSQFVLVLAEDLNPAVLNAALPSDFPPVRILKEDAYEAMAAADLVLSACGTANLEAALLGTPFIAFYRVLPLTYWAFIRLVKTSSYSIVNILAGKKIVPELIQRDFTADNVFREAKAILESEDGGEKMKSRFRLIRTSLGSGHASRNVAEELAGLI
jgi:lipid-A-disaccharide synthase